MGHGFKTEWSLIWHGCLLFLPSQFRPPHHAVLSRSRAFQGREKERTKAGEGQTRKRERGQVGSRAWSNAEQWAHTLRSANLKLPCRATATTYFRDHPLTGCTHSGENSRGHCAHVCFSSGVCLMLKHGENGALPHEQHQYQSLGSCHPPHIPFHLGGCPYGI